MQSLFPNRHAVCEQYHYVLAIESQVFCKSYQNVYLMDVEYLSDDILTFVYKRGGFGTLFEYVGNLLRCVIRKFVAPLQFLGRLFFFLFDGFR